MVQEQLGMARAEERTGMAETYTGPAAIEHLTTTGDEEVLGGGHIQGQGHHHPEEIGVEMTGIGGSVVLLHIATIIPATNDEKSMLASCKITTLPRVNCNLHTEPHTCPCMSQLHPQNAFQCS